MEAAWERKRLKYANLAAKWRTTIYLVEVGCRGFMGTSAVHLIRDLGVAGASLRKVEEVEKSSFWLWKKRKDVCGGKLKG